MNRAHLQTLLWLRWRLTQHQLARGGRLNAIVSLAALWCGVVLGVVGGLGGVLVGWLIVAPHQAKRAETLSRRES